MEKSIQTDIERLDDNFVVVKTTTTEKYSNQEFYTFWGKLKSRLSQTNLMISSGEDQLSELKHKKDLEEEYISKFDHMAKDCEVRI